MKSRTATVNLKLGLIVFAMIIALASLLYANGLVERLRDRERASMEIWSGARQEVARSAISNPYRQEFYALADQIGGITGEDADRMREALTWAYRQPQGEHTDFFVKLFSEYYQDVPAVIMDTLHRPIAWRNLAIPEQGPHTAEDSLAVQERARRMNAYDPIAIDVPAMGSSPGLRQWVYYDDSRLIRELRIFPYVQLLFVGLLVMVGYMGFSYVRRNEQSNLWVGMAREAAHQLGTPLSSLLGWNELLRQQGEADENVVNEMSHDLERLGRITNRFNDIGSVPKLVAQPVAPSISNTADYMRRRIPQNGVELEVSVPEDLKASLNTELFEWVIENLIKNALDAMQGAPGKVSITARKEARRIRIEVADSGKGIDRRFRKDIFRPGYSTKTRGWGLGLSLARRIVQDYHGGSLTLAHSAPGQGATFRIELPAT